MPELYAAIRDNIFLFIELYKSGCFSKKSKTLPSK